MNKYTYDKYEYLLKKKGLNKKIITIKKVSDKVKYINNIYYPIIDTIFLIKYMHYDLGNYRNIYKIKIYFNLFELKADIKIYKIKKQNYLETTTLLNIFNDMNCKNFNKSFILSEIIDKFYDVQHLEMLPILLKCREKIKEEYMIFFVLVNSIFIKGKIYLSKDIVRTIIGFII